MLDKVTTRVKKLEEASAEVREWRGKIDSEMQTAQKQRNKLFSEVHDIKSVVSSSNGKLDLILEAIAKHDAADEAHDYKLKKADSELKKAREDREALRVTIEGMVTDEINSKGLPASGTKLYGCASVAGMIGSVLLGTLQYIPEITDAVLRIIKALR